MKDMEFFKLRRRADRMNLKGAWRLYDTQKALEVCNGIGAEWMPSWMRDMVTAFNPTLTPASMIHDMEYSYGGRWQDRLSADWTFLANGFRSARCHYTWLSPCRYLVMFQSIKFFILLRLFGAAAYKWRRRNG